MAEVITEAQAPTWSQWITDFDKSWNLFNENYSGLKAVGPYVYSKHPELVPQYEKLMSTAQEHYNTLVRLRDVRNSVANWLTGFTGGLANVLAAPARWLSGLFGGGLNGLGVAPLIVAVGIASAGTALVLIGRWIADAFAFAQKLNALQKLEAAGHAPADALNIIKGLNSGTLFGIPWKWIVVGGVIIFLGPPLLKMIEGRK
jgi:hypothetical protein